MSEEIDARIIHDRIRDEYEVWNRTFEMALEALMPQIIRPHSDVAAADRLIEAADLIALAATKICRERLDEIIKRLTPKGAR